MPHLSATADYDVFPPRRTSASEGGMAASYNPDGMMEFWLHEYEDVLHEVFGATDDENLADEFGVIAKETSGSQGIVYPGMMDMSAWRRLSELLAEQNEDEVISDSESIVTVGELEDARLEDGMGRPEASQPGENTWAVSLVFDARYAWKEGLTIRKWHQ